MVAATSSRPTWQHDPCPAWCVVEHRESDPPADRVHDSIGVYVPVTLRRTESEPSQAELLIVLSRHCDEATDWVFVGEPDRDGQHLTLSGESAARVSSTLAALVTQAATEC